VARACRAIEDAHEPLDLPTLAAAVGMSQYHLHRVFKAATGLTPKAYADAHRGRRVRRKLDEQHTVTDAIYDAGFGSAGRFYANSNRRLGMAPARYRTGGAHEDIRFAVGECSMGSILVAATNKGVSAIQFGDDPEALLQRFQDRFPSANLIGADTEFESLVARVVAMVEEPTTATPLPLDIKGTAFQERVWRALMTIPPGTTATYRDIAERIGSPRAVRAVAAACGANPLAVAIPCHRVIRTDGTLAGYRWGIDRKRALLSREQQVPREPSAAAS
jgi:AraC family transcriptional regulator of adaptative response/methylated-DNA-[protein]-cysteine methyltransferase